VIRATGRTAARLRAATAWSLLLMQPWAVFGQEPGVRAPDEPAGDHAPTERGAAIVEERFCRNCHRIGTEGTPVGPDLDQVTLRRSEEWLRRWLTDPPAIRPGTLMPIYGWTDEELDALIGYLARYRSPVNGAEILTRAGTGIEGGKALVDAYQCWACHTIADRLGRPIYPDLGTLKERRTADWTKTWLEDPQAVKPGTFMPTFGFSAAQIEAITRFLYR
jgi:cytochrome c2